MKRHPLFCIALTLAGLCHGAAGMVRLDDEPAPYVRAIEEKGSDPIPFVVDTLTTRDLIIFDDAVHNAVEPFEFYQQLVRDTAFQELAPTIFIEAISINQQPHLDAYFATAPEDPTLLYPAFQNDFSGYGWRYQTYFDLLHTIYEVNRELPDDQRLNVVGVANPSYWSEIHTARDYELFTQRALLSFDYSMYQIILAELDRFESGRKGVFFTNTRHAYKGVRRADGTLHWNLGTFFAQWHPGKTMSVRCHNVFLSITPRVEPGPGGVASAQGLDGFDIGWVRPARGLWDAAFAACGNHPVVVPLADTPFGRDPYLGNHMRSAAPDSTMLDAYDAVLFLAPLETLRQSAISDAITTPEFLPEMIRRHRILTTEETIQSEMREAGVETVEALLLQLLTSRPESLSPQSQAAGPADEWRDTN